LRWGTEWSGWRRHRRLGSGNTLRRRHASAILVVLPRSLGTGGTPYRARRSGWLLFLILILRVADGGGRRLVLTESH